MKFMVVSFIETKFDFHLELQGSIMSWNFSNFHVVVPVIHIVIRFLNHLTQYIFKKY